jgi:hypothetical protein
MTELFAVLAALSLGKGRVPAAMVAGGGVAVTAAVALLFPCVNWGLLWCFYGVFEYFNGFGWCF